MSFEKWLKMSPEERQEFWKWVCSLEVTDDPRGEFVDDTKLLKRVYNRRREDWWEVCSGRLLGPGEPTVSVFEGLVAEFNQAREARSAQGKGEET